MMRFNAKQHHEGFYALLARAPLGGVSPFEYDGGFELIASQWRGEAAFRLRNYDDGTAIEVSLPLVAPPLFSVDESKLPKHYTVVDVVQYLADTYGWVFPIDLLLAWSPTRPYTRPWSPRTAQLTWYRRGDDEISGLQLKAPYSHGFSEDQILLIKRK